MKVGITDSSTIFFLHEGGAEEAIINILLDNDLLIFKREQLYGCETIKRMPVKDFQKRFLIYDYGDSPVTIIRMIDSKNEKFELKEPYSCQVGRPIITVITSPEIEILIIIAEGHYDKFSRSSRKKASEYCKIDLKMKGVKSQDFVRKYFSDTNKLIGAIKEYHSRHEHRSLKDYHTSNQPKKEIQVTLYDIIRK